MSNYVFHAAFHAAEASFRQDALSKWIRIRMAESSLVREILGADRLGNLRVLMRRYNMHGTWILRAHPLPGDARAGHG